MFNSLIVCHPGTILGVLIRISTVPQIIDNRGGKIGNGCTMLVSLCVVAPMHYVEFLRKAYQAI